ncbi:MAG: threonine-phosphate decarboxylase CobD [Paracoccaceae bacterium]
MRDHGGNLDWAIVAYGGDAAQWIDLSTGINRVPYPVPQLPPEVWTMLPTRAATDLLIAAAADHYRTEAPVLVTAGAQAAIQMMPWLAGASGLARVISPTYNEHAAVLRHAGWRVEEVAGLAGLAGADLAVVVNPNNPDGKTYAPADLAGMIGQVGRLVVDESFGDVTPELSMLPHAGQPGLIVMRSFGKFWGLAGARLGLIYGVSADIDALRGMAGPWPVAGAALEIGRQAYADRDWADATRARLASEVPRIDDLARTAGWAMEGGTALFRLYATPDAGQAQDCLARAQIWSRIFPWHPSWLRLGLPGTEAEWARLAAVLAA